MLRVGILTHLLTGPFSGNSTALKLPEATFIVSNPGALNGAAEGTAFLARYSPTDQFCTVINDAGLDAMGRVLAHFEDGEKKHYEENGMPDNHIYRDMRKAQGMTANSIS